MFAVQQRLKMNELSAHIIPGMQLSKGPWMTSTFQMNIGQPELFYLLVLANQKIAGHSWFYFSLLVLANRRIVKFWAASTSLLITLLLLHQYTRYIRTCTRWSPRSTDVQLVERG